MKETENSKETTFKNILLSKIRTWHAIQADVQKHNFIRISCRKTIVFKNVWK